MSAVVKPSGVDQPPWPKDGYEALVRGWKLARPSPLMSSGYLGSPIWVLTLCHLSYEGSLFVLFI